MKRLSLGSMGSENQQLKWTGRVFRGASEGLGKLIKNPAKETPVTVVFLLIGVVLMPMFWVLRLFKRDIEHAQRHQPYQQFLQGKVQHQPLSRQNPERTTGVSKPHQ